MGVFLERHEIVIEINHVIFDAPAANCANRPTAAARLFSARDHLLQGVSP
jgi:hypothetical protein